jgi:hypothetical protein
MERVDFACRELETNREVIRGRARDNKTVYKRWIIACFLYKLGLNYSQIGRKLNRDHQTIMHALDNSTTSMWDIAYHILVKYDDYIAPKKKVPNYKNSKFEVIRC